MGLVTAKAQEWLGSSFDEKTREEVKALMAKEDKSDLIDAFYKVCNEKNYKLHIYATMTDFFTSAYTDDAAMLRKLDPDVDMNIYMDYSMSDYQLIKDVVGILKSNDALPADYNYKLGDNLSEFLQIQNLLLLCYICFCLQTQLS